MGRRIRRSGMLVVDSAVTEGAYRSVVRVCDQALITLPVELDDSRTLWVETCIHRQSCEESSSRNGDCSGVNHFGLCLMLDYCGSCSSLEKINSCIWKSDSELDNGLMLFNPGYRVVLCCPVVLCGY